MHSQRGSWEACTVAVSPQRLVPSLNSRLRQSQHGACIEGLGHEAEPPQRWRVEVHLSQNLRQDRQHLLDDAGGCLAEQYLVLQCLGSETALGWQQAQGRRGAEQSV